MHQQAEIGIAAHFSYSESGKSINNSEMYWVNELKNIVSQSESGEFLHDMQIRIFDDQIFALTPKGDVKILTKGSTPIDFAYSIHSDLGNHLMIARVNDKVVPLDHQLESGDKVDIVTDKSRSPSISWLSIVKTPRAREVIRAYINKEQRTELIEK
jgi:(p)ppGpp synthase/HD superfamily hydrolase